jgi:chorismate mutase/prephenate dehydratase
VTAPVEPAARATAAGDPSASGDRTSADIAARANKATDPTAEALAPLRQRIDTIDHEIVALLNERAQIALEIGSVKQVTGRRTVRDAAREAQVLEHVTSTSAGLFPEPELVSLYRKLIAATRRVQHAQKRDRGRGGDAGPTPG